MSHLLQSHRYHVCSPRKEEKLRIYSRKESQEKKIVWDNLLDLLRVTNRTSQKPLCSREALLQDELQMTLWYSWQAQFSVFPITISVWALSITMLVCLWVCLIVLSSPATEKNTRDWVLQQKRIFAIVTAPENLIPPRICLNKCIWYDEENAEGAAEDGDKWIGLAYLYNKEILSLGGENSEVVVLNNIWQWIISLKFMLHCDS